MRKLTTPREMAKMLGIPAGRAQEGYFKAELISEVKEHLKRKNITHAELAKKSGVPRSAVTGILNASLQSVSLERVLRMAGALGIEVEFRIKRSA